MSPPGSPTPRAPSPGSPTPRPEDARRELEPAVGAELQLSVQSLETSVKDACGEAGRAEGLERIVARRRRLVIWAVVLLCLAGALQGILVNGLINVVISSIEKRFGIRSSDSGFIANSYDIASFLCLLPVSYLGGRGSGSKPAWIGAGVALLGLGSLLFSLPHLLAGPVAGADGWGGGPSGTLCGAARDQVCDVTREETDDNRYKYVFMAAQLLHGAGAAPLYTLGVTYIDETVGPTSSAFYLGIFYTMAIVGPAIGYALGGHLLTIHTDLLPHISIDDSSWVGAWWIGFVFCGVAFLVVAGPLFWLPASIPGATQPSGEQVCRSRVTSIVAVGSRGSSFRAPAVHHRRLQQDEQLGAAPGPLPVGRELVDQMVNLVSNPTFICLSLSGAFEGFLMTGLATFLPKFIQNTYGLSASEAALNVGAISVVAGGGGTLLGGLAVKRLGLKVPGLLKMTALTQLVAILMATGLLAGCEPAPVVGLQGGPSAGPCAAGCACDRMDYQPVCGDKVQYYNPCFAGCRAREPTSFTNCTCLSGGAGTALPGPCPADCPLLPLFLASLFLSLFVTFLANMPSLTATLRCVDPSARSLALGIQWLIIRLLGTIPGPVAMGKLFDLACTTWRQGCSGPSDHCVLYDNTRIGSNVMTLTGICKGLSILAFLAGLRLYKLPVGPEVEEKGKELSGEGEGKKQEVKEKEVKEKEVKS